MGGGRGSCSAIVDAARVGSGTAWHRNCCRETSISNKPRVKCITPGYNEIMSNHTSTEAAEVAATCTAFAGGRRIASGSLPDIAQTLAAHGPQEEAILVFDDTTGALVDTPPTPEQTAKLAAKGASSPSAASSTPTPARAAGAGRPRLGVVAREVTLLPRHWQWLSVQPGGASAALRRLVDEARRTHSERDTQRAAAERTYRFMSAIAGHEPGFEEASRALFAHDGPKFSTRIEAWPHDVRVHLERLSQGAFGTGA